ncbi:MAG: hypothetical protein ACK5UE_06790 [Chitinophagales bacterium]|jgi:hypothetical protein|nr:hypothetical protein [Sphingobacteriales bacterium]
MARVIKVFIGFISFALLLSCGKDIEVLTPVKDCKITGTYSQKNNEWRYLNYNNEGKIVSTSDQYFSHFIQRDKLNSTLKFIYSDTETYSKVEDTIICKRHSDKKILRKFYLRNNLLDQIIDSQNQRIVKLFYLNNSLTKEEFYDLSSANKSLFFVREFQIEEGDVFDYYNVIRSDYSNLENRIVSEFYGLSEKYGRHKSIKVKRINSSGTTFQDNEYNFSYETNERGLISKKIVAEVKQGLYKDTVNYTYTCKF